MLSKRKGLLIQFDENGKDSSFFKKITSVGINNKYYVYITTMSLLWFSQLLICINAFLFLYQLFIARYTNFCYQFKLTLFSNPIWITNIFILKWNCSFKEFSLCANAFAHHGLFDRPLVIIIRSQNDNYYLLSVGFGDQLIWCFQLSDQLMLERQQIQKVDIFTICLRVSLICITLHDCYRLSP